MIKTKLKVITPHGLFFDDNVEIVTVKTTEGEMGVIHGLSPVVASLTVGSLWIGPVKENKECAIAGGLMYATPTGVTIITDAIEYRENIDLVRAEKAREAALAKLKAQLDVSEEIKIKFALERALNRINVKKGF